VAHAVCAGQVSEPSHDREGRLTSGLVDVENTAYETGARASLRRQ